VTDVALGQVKERAATRVAWSVLAIYATGLACTGVIAVLNGSGTGDNVVLLYLPAFTAFMVVGALVVARRPDNAMGWLFSAIGLLSLGALVAMEYIHYAYMARPGGLPFAVLAAWYLAWAAFPVFGLTFAFTLLLFPTGRLLSPRWRPFAWLAGIQITAASVLAALQPTLALEEEGRTIPNPIGISGLPLADQGTVGAVLNGMFTVASLAGCVSLVLRFRRARGEERQQLKWVAYAAALMVISFLVVVLFVPGGTSDVAMAFTIALLPIAAGIAILRYRLYEIDRLISRTLVYGLLTAILGGVYAAIVLVLGQLFGGIGDSPPSWAVAGATLSVAALFQPARRHIQAAVDRRFNRRKYNTAKTVEAFSVRLRDEIDLDALTAELLAVVDQTIQPTRASLWLRPSAQDSRRTTP
jgi:peptidoglycan/LPS O-acetylase OafA/YrhL